MSEQVYNMMIFVWPLHFVNKNRYVEQDVDDQTIETTRYSRDIYTDRLTTPKRLSSDLLYRFSIAYQIGATSIPMKNWREKNQFKIEYGKAFYEARSILAVNYSFALKVIP